MSHVLKFKDKHQAYLERTQRNHFFLGGPKGQEKIKNLNVAIAGLGGMGSNITEYLVRLGVNNINIADMDTIDFSNINRQVIANRDSVGQKKAIASQNEILKIDPDLNLKVFTEGVTEETVDEFIKGADFVIDEIDVFPLEAHQLLHKKCREQSIPIYSSYVIGLGIHFYKFHGDDFTFDDFIQVESGESDEARLEKITDSFLTHPQSYLNKSNVEAFKKMALDHGVPIFGPSCLVGHSIVVTRILCDFLGSQILGQEIPTTPIMPEYIKVDLVTLELKKESFSKK